MDKNIEMNKVNDEQLENINGGATAEQVLNAVQDSNILDYVGEKANDVLRLFKYIFTHK